MRFPYIDKLKALAMLMVVMGHTMYFCMYHELGSSDPILNIICTFHVPLFFFLSGFVISRAPDVLKFLGKARRFLVPMLVVGFINALLISRVRDFFLNGGHNGYWYLLTLTLFYFLLLPFQLTVRKTSLRTFLADGVMAITIWLFLTVMKKYLDDDLSALNLWGAYAYWPFFVIGFLFRKYSLTAFITGRRWVTALLVLAYLTLLVTFFGSIDRLPLYLDFSIALLAIFALVSLFHAFDRSNTFVDRQLVLIGNSTLHIYIFHYFFIRFIDLSFLKSASITIELLVTIPLTLAIVYGSIAIGRLWDRISFSLSVTDKLKNLAGLLQRPITQNPVFYIGMMLLCTVSIVFTIYGNSRFKSEIELFSDVYFLCALTMLFPSSWKKHVKAVVFGLFFLIGFVDMLCYLLMGAPLIPSIVITWLQTNGQEATEALSTYLSPRLILSPLVLFLLLPPFLYWLRRIRFTIPRYVATLLLIVTLFSLVGSINNKRYLYYIYTRTSDDDMEEQCDVESQTREYLPVYRVLLSAKEISRLKYMRQRLVDNAKVTQVDSCSFRSPLIVLIIGESYNRHHASLYGYPKATTPRQDSLFSHGELYRFNDVIASYNLTFKAFQHMLSLYDYDRRDSWYNHPLVPVLFRKAGYDVYFFSNQYSLDKRSAFSDFIEDSFINNIELSPLMFTHRNEKTHDYDIGLLDDYRQSAASSSQRPRLVMFHFIGIHNDFSQRFPPDWQYFKPADYAFRSDLGDSEKLTLADYDNAIRYNDYVVDSIVSTFSHDEAVVIYVPDHGELVYDGGAEFGRNLQLTANYVKPQFDIPFWIYCSDAYRTAHPDLCRQMAAAVDRPFMTDDLPHLLLYLAGIVIPDYRPERNLIDDCFNSQRKRMIRGEADYDIICKE